MGCGKPLGENWKTRELTGDLFLRSTFTFLIKMFLKSSVPPLLTRPCPIRVSPAPQTERRRPRRNHDPCIIFPRRCQLPRRYPPLCHGQGALPRAAVKRASFLHNAACSHLILRVATRHDIETRPWRTTAGE